MTSDPIENYIGTAQARAGLLGNPSDAYGGRVIATTLPQFEAKVTVTAADEWQCDIELLDATVTALRELHPALVAEPAALSFVTTIPRQVGLSGSSAIVIATLRALAERAAFRWDLVELARVALFVETQVLGWAAGPQDRVVQAYEGLVDMDFADAWQASAYHRLDSATLPTLFVAWNQSMGQPSDVAHSNVRDRWLANDAPVRTAMNEFAQLAAQGRAALDAGTATSQWPDLLDRAFDLRSSIFSIASVDRALVETAQRFDAGAAFAGSGGAIVGCPRSVDSLPALAQAYEQLGAGFAMVKR